jgi:hypothetical protein
VDRQRLRFEFAQQRLQPARAQIVHCQRPRAGDAEPARAARQACALDNAAAR